jgi:hypothetical protein
MARSSARSRPRIVRDDEPQEPKFFDQYVEESNVPPFLLPISADETIEVHAPDTDAMRDLREAQLTQDVDLMITSVFGRNAERMAELVDGKNYLVINRIVRDIMRHFGRTLEDLPES